MTGRTSGLQRDVEIIRRRAWLFLPFLIIGIIVAIVLGLRSGGNSTASATVQLQTSIYELKTGGDRGFRIYDAQTMTRLPQFRKEVIQQIGDKDFDYARFTIILSPNVDADGASAGNLVVSLNDPDRATAQKYVQDFVTVFNREFTSPNGLFRTQYLKQQQTVANTTEKQYEAAYAKLQQLAATEDVNVPLGQLLDAGQQGGYLEQLGQQRAALASQQAQAEAALGQLADDQPGADAAIASGILDQPVAAGDAKAVLQAHVASLKAAISSLDSQIATASGASLKPDFRAQLDKVSALDSMRSNAADSLANAEAALSSGVTTADASYSQSGARVQSTLALAAIAIGITLVFGLIAIYLVEWLSQLREAPPSDEPSVAGPNAHR